MDVTKYAKDFAKQHAFYERKVMPIFYQALADSVIPVIKSLDVNDLNPNVWQQAYQKAYKLIGQRAALKEYQFLKATNGKDDVIDFLNTLFGQRMAAYGATVAFNIENELNNTTIEDIRKALQYAFENSYTTTQTQRLLRESVIDKKRALLIARTETTTAANQAKLEGAKEYFAEIGETEGYKVWITRMDGKERHTHMEENETAVGFNDKFVVGGFNCTAPGDPSLPGKERIRCRCTFVTLSAAGYRRRFGQ